MEQSTDLNLYAIFARVAELRSFTAAAASLQMPKSTVSRSIKRLEIELNTPLFRRSTRLVELTPLGQKLFSACYSELASLTERLRSVLTVTEQPSRLIRMTAVEDMGAQFLPDVIALFAKRYPLVRFELVLSNEQVNLISGGIDIAIRVGKLPQTSYIKRTVGSIGFILVASARYRDRYPSIGIKDIVNHPLLVLPSYAHKRQNIQMVNGLDTARVPINVRATATNTAALLNMVRLDLGVGLLPDFLCREGLAEGTLVRLCAGWQTLRSRVALLYTATMPRDPLVKEFGDTVFEQFKRRLVPG